jgi:hypothetical protein
MKTKDFIKMLQNADPSGEAHVRIDGGIPYYAELKPGYYDGAYSYIDEEGNYVYTTQGDKVDIYQKDIEDFVHDCFNLHDPKRNTWESIKDKFKFSLGYSIEAQRKERENVILNEAKEAYDSIKEIEQSSFDRSLEEMKNNAIKGWVWFQNKDVDKDEKPNYHVYYTWKIYDENKKEQGSNVWMTQCVQKSGFWEKLDNNVKPGYYEWVCKNK